MPHVLWELQGYQKAVYEGESDAEHEAVHKEFTGFELVQKGRLTPQEYDQFVRDTVNFLDYIGEPMQLERAEPRAARCWDSCWCSSCSRISSRRSTGRT